MKTRTILYADEGKILTNGEVYNRRVHLRNDETPDDYREITREEYEEIVKTKESEGDMV